MRPFPSRPSRLPRLPLRVAVTLAWMLAAIAVASLAAGCGPRWPKVGAVYHSEFAADPGRISTIDVLPADIDVGVSDQIAGAPATIAETINREVLNTALAELQRRNYRVTWIDWNGRHHGGGDEGQAMEPQAVAETTESLHSYGRAQRAAAREGHAGTLVPHLPRRLGTATGSDATLYVGGKAFVGKPPVSPGETAGKVVLGVVLVAFIVIAVVAIAASDDGDIDLPGGGKKRSRRSRRGGRLAAVARGTRARSSGSSRRTRRRGSSRSVGGSSLGSSLADIAFDWYWYERPVDSHGRPDTHIHYVTPNAPREVQTDKHAWVELEFTLVSNATGHVQWHAQQRFEIAPQNSKHLRKAVKRMFDTLPHPSPTTAQR